MPTSLAYKLRLTAAALNCATRKELCQRFRAVAPATVVDLDSCHKWLQGVAKPRNPSVYEDWARLIGTRRPGAWIAACSPEAFATELCALLSADRAELEARAARFGGGRAAPRPGAAALPVADLRAGAFVAYSWAMAPRFAGRLIRGLLTLDPGRGGRLAARYEEGFATGALRFAGQATESGRTLHLDLAAAEDPGIGRFFMVLLTHGRPLGALCGEFIGAPVHDSVPLPTASRIAMIRIEAKAVAAAAAPECYVPAEAAALASDLGRMGFAAYAAGAVAGELLDILGRPRPPIGRTGAEELARLAEACEAARPAAPQPLALVMR